MAGSVNKVIIIGNLGRDPEVRTTQGGAEVCTLSVATSESWTDKQSGERKERTEWHRAVIWNEHLVRVAKEYLQKGSKVYLEGQLETRKWTDQSGQEKYSTEIVLRPYRGELTILSSPEREGQSGNAGDQRRNQTPAGKQGGYSNDFEDDIPFAWASIGLMPWLFALMGIA